MKTIHYELADGIATITFDEPDSPVNTMCLQWQEDMAEAAAQVLQDKDADQGHRPGLGQDHLLCRCRPQRPDAPTSPPTQRRLQGDRAPQAALPHHRDPGQTGGQLPQRHCARAAAGKWRWWATTASRWTTPRSSSACPRSRWA